MKIRYVLICLTLLFGLAGIAIAWHLKNNKSDTSGSKLAKPAATKSEKQMPEPKTSSIRLVATGDMIPSETINLRASQPDGSYDYKPFMADMKPYFDAADIRFCNQATPAGGEEFGITGYPVFNAPVQFTKDMEATGCNLINLGSNHTNDRGQNLIDASVAAWDNRPNILAVAGANRSAAERDKLRVFTIKGVKFAFLSFTTYSNTILTNDYGVAVYSDALAKKQISQARSKADFIIVSMRWGTEYSPDINDHQEMVSQKVADYGADVILGHGPHALEPVKKLKSADGRDVYVWYSLGNFLNSQLDIESLICSFAVLDIDVESKKVTNVAFMPVYQHYEWTASQKQRGSNADLLQRRNFKMLPLDKASSLLARSQNNTTVKDQTARVRNLLNKYTPVKIITSAEY